MNPKVAELFIRRKNLNIPVVFITQSYFVVPKIIRPNSVHYFAIKFQNKRELQHIVFNHSWDIDFQDFMNLYKKCTTKPYSFLVVDATLPSDNPLHFRKNLVERIEKLIMAIDDQVRDKKLQSIKRESAKISALSSGKIDEYKYLTVEVE